MNLAYCIFYTNDLEMATSFYRDKIGLEVVSKDERFTTFRIGKGLLGIKVHELDREVPGHQTAIIEDDKIDELYKLAQEQSWGIFTPLVFEEWGKNFSILDPDGNRVEFYHL
mgnify:CR=1 FL=1